MVNKYRNIKTVIDGITFDSKKEGTRFRELLLLQRAGEITIPDFQPQFKIEVNGVKICTYRADFGYNRIKEPKVYVVEDVKSEATRKLPVYRLKKKLMKAVLNIDITEI